ncbi:Sec1-like protein [Rhodocollybia butyracea]|uniref:Sec1-like protein n=1 Tax=Rhodocollybia butyracea TaxID=206335 RepID=A0A9P5PSP0_9AGAR|nr:Sec1-like protein [Rhodocollybia butyracea]
MPHFFTGHTQPSLTTLFTRIPRGNTICQPTGKWKILVVDEHSQKILGTVLKQFDILEENVTQIESISNYRDAQPGLEAIDSPQYAGAHLFFIEGLAEPLFTRLGSSPAEPYLRTLQELFLNFRAMEAQAFSLDQPELLFSLFSPPEMTISIAPLVIVWKRIFDLRAKLLQTELSPLGPLKPHASTRPPPPPENATRWRTNLARGDQARAYESVESDYVSKILAFMVQSNLDDYKKQNANFGKHESRPRATLIITDRSMDMMAPFIHEFTYQAMANDLLPIDDGMKYTYKFQSSIGAYEDKTAILSDADNVWTEVRHMHMREAIDKLMADFNKFLEENAVFKGDNAANLNDMKDMLANLPQYQEQREKFSLHLTNVEQHLVEEMVPLLDSREVVNANKVRIIALYIQFREGVPDEDRRRLYQHARLSLAEQDAVNALTHFGVRISRGPSDKDMKKKLKQKPADDSEYDLSRYKPLIKTILEDCVNDKLDAAMFPYVKDGPAVAPASASLRSPPPASSLRSAKPSWHRAARPNVVENRPRVLVFVAGGMTYSEIRETYQLSASLNKDIYIGSTHVITPRQFVDDLKVVELGGVGSRVAPNGLRDSRGQRPFQEYYDDRYYTKDGLGHSLKLLQLRVVLQLPKLRHLALVRRRLTTLPSPARPL